jgi:hypothetical protein
VKYIVTLSSDAFGEEDFEYNSLEEQLAGFERLRQSCTLGYFEDKIPRLLTLHIGEEEAEDNS